jgi:hypothetical protein
LPPPPRKVVIERLAVLPNKPQAVIVERWLPYTQQKRKGKYLNERLKYIKLWNLFFLSKILKNELHVLLLF